MADPFLLPRPATLGVSGGRTSGLMLRRTLDAFGGALPADVVPVFCNTGKERPETLDFVEELSQRWGVGIVWLEYRWEPGRHYFERVCHRTASRNGEPFRQAIEARGFLPNPVMRFCTAELKIRTANRFVRQALGWETYHNAVGLRADEPARVAKLLRKRTVTLEPTLFGDERKVVRAADHPPGEQALCPLAEAGVTNEDVLAFWRSQPFDLALPADPRTGRTLGGNCDLCFLKGAGTIVELMRQQDDAADWWIEMEEFVKHRDRNETKHFRADRPRYVELKMIADGSLTEPGWLWADRGGMACGGVTDDCNCTD